jgi:hypothetical protein
MTVDWASLTFNALGLRALADVPVRARLEDTGSTTAIEVTVGIGVLVSEASCLGDIIVLGHALPTVRERELAKREGSWGDKSLCGGDGQAGSNKLLIEVERVSRDG